MTPDFQAGVTCNGGMVSVMGVPSESLDGAPYAVWAMSEEWLVAINIDLMARLWQLEDMLPDSDVRRIISLWAVSLAEDMEISDDKHSF